jgi:hypothetical protein
LTFTSRSPVRSRLSRVLVSVSFIVGMRAL